KRPPMCNRTPPRQAPPCWKSDGRFHPFSGQSPPPAFDAERASVRTNGKLHIDGIGITLIALASAALEVALDRGQIDDWFGSPFISWMLAIGVIGWIATVVWEIRLKEPVIDFRLLASRNFAIASTLFFVF